MYLLRRALRTMRAADEARLRPVRLIRESEPAGQVTRLFGSPVRILRML
jgi:hypothetical protein